MRRKRRGADRPVDERGVALPLALFGLVVVSILVTSVLLTSSTELALSRAHQDATRGLYAADAALEQFVATRAAMVTGADQRFVAGTYPVDLPSGRSYDLGVAELHRSPMIDRSDGSVERRETYSLIVEPRDGRGRSVGALIEVLRTAAPVALNVNTGLTLGVKTTVAGSARISDGSDDGGAPCDSTAADAAILRSAEAVVDIRGSGNNVVGEIEQDSREAAELLDYILEGDGIDDLAKLAKIKFGELLIDGDTFATGDPLIRFNRCEIVNAQRGLTVSSLETADQEIQTSTFAWYEIVR